MSLYEGTIGEQEYAHGRSDGRAAGEYDARNFPATVWAEIEDARMSADSLSRRTRAYWLGWLRGYREVTRR